MNVSRSASARSDLNGIAEYYDPLNPAATLAMLDRIVEVERVLAEHPYIGHPGRLAGTREFVVSGTPFVLVYVVGGDTITILRVLDGRRDWPGD